MLFYKKLIFCFASIICILPLFPQEFLEDSSFSTEAVTPLLDDVLSVQVSRLDFNSDRSDFCPVFYKNGIIFYSNREKSKKSDADFISNAEADIFYVELKHNSFSEPIVFNDLISNSYYEGALTFNFNFNKMFVSKYESSLDGKVKEKDKLKGLHIFESDIDTSLNKLNTIDPLPFNLQGFSFVHPTTSSNGDMLIFASDIPDGFGGSDLYITKQNKGFWMPPENLGDKINTPDDEYFPYLFQDSILFFVSNKPGGSGKFDVYLTTLNNLIDPVNLGAPINSKFDDFSLIVSADGEHGYFSTNRDEANKEDVYQFNLVSGSVQEFIEEIIKVNGNTNMPKDNAEPIEITDNYLYQPEKPNGGQQNNLVFKVQVAASKVQLSTEELRRKYKGERPVLMFQEEGWYKYYIGEYHNYFLADKLRKESGVKDAFVVAYKQEDKLVLMDALRAQYQKEKEEYKIVAEDIHDDWEVVEKQEMFFDFNSFEESGFNSGALNDIVNLLGQNQRYQLAIFAYADYWGSADYNLALSAERGRLVKEYLVDKGVTENRILIRSLGEKFTGDKDTAPQLYNEQENRTNRKVEFIIYKLK